MDEDNSVTQQMQNKVDKLKLLNLTSNIHSLTPPKDKNSSEENNVVLVQALKVAPRLAEDILMLQGRVIDPKTMEIKQVTRPIMNLEGIWLFFRTCKPLATETEWAAFSEEELPARLIHYYEQSFPYFTFWYEDYDLDPRDFNVIETILQAYIDAAFHKARHGKYINTVGRTYSEDLLSKAINNDNQTKKDEGFGKWNPFGRKK